MANNIDRVVGLVFIISSILFFYFRKTLYKKFNLKKFEQKGLVGSLRLEILIYFYIAVVALFGFGVFLLFK